MKISIMHIISLFFLRRPKATARHQNPHYTISLLIKVCQKIVSERFLVNIFLTNTDIAQTKVSLEGL